MKNSTVLGIVVTTAMLILASNGKTDTPPVPDEVIENADLLETLQLLTDRLTAYEQREAERDAELAELSRDLEAQRQSAADLQKQLADAESQLAIAQMEPTVDLTADRHYTQGELRKMAYDHALSRPRGSGGNYVLAATVDPPNQVWNHLVNDHGFTFEQVNGLSYNDALWLHSGAHAGVITPTTSGEAITDVRMPAATTRRVQTRVYYQNCPNGQCYRRN